jgi:hypothetical protein
MSVTQYPLRVTSLNSLNGALSLVAGTNITITPSGSSITVDASGGGGGGANTALSNLASVAINTNLSFANGMAGSEASVLTADAPAAANPSDGIKIKTGDQNAALSVENTGAITIHTGDNYGDGITGSMDIKTGYQGSSTNRSGSIAIQTGYCEDPSPNATGFLLFATGDTTSGNTGNVTIKSGASGAAGSTGSLTIQSGDALGDASGDVTIQSGRSDTGTGTVYVRGGPAYTAGVASGEVNILSGNVVAVNSDSGGVVIQTGSTPSGNNTGAIDIRTSNVGGAGVSGDIGLNVGNSSNDINHMGKITMQAQAVSFPQHATAPSTPAEGDCYYDTVLHKLRCYDGSTWNNLF